MGSTKPNSQKLIDLIAQCNEKEKSYLESFFAHAPQYILEGFVAVEYPKDYVFIQEKAAVDTVYILLEGTVRGVDYRILGIAYNYMYFNPVQAFGAMEIIIHCDQYKTTLETVTPCKLLMISKEKYEKWIHTDIQALLMQTSTMVEYLLEQAQKERLFLFTQGIERVILLFINLYEQSKKDHYCFIELKRQDLSDLTGLSVKTINRMVKKLTLEHYISRDGNKIRIEESQYLKMKKFISYKFDS